MRTILTLAACLILAGECLAQEITYDLVNYPALQGQDPYGGYDWVTGTVTTDGKIGSLTAADIVGLSISISGADGSFASTLGSLQVSSTGLSATATQLMLSPTGTLNLLKQDNDYARVGGLGFQYALYYEGPHPADPPFYGASTAEIYQGQVHGNINNYCEGLAEAFTGQFPVGSPWLIATTADPPVIVNGFWKTASIPSGADLTVTAGGTLLFERQAAGASVTPVPEPGTLQLSCLAAMAICAGRMLRRKERN